MKAIHYLVFSGGGVAIYGHAGAILELAKQPNFSIDAIKGVAGVSGGSIAALLVSLNYSEDYIAELIKSIDLKQFVATDGLLARTCRLFKNYGMYKGKNLYQFILQILRDKTGRSDPENLTFMDLRQLGYKDLYIVTTKLFKENNDASAKQKIFSAEKTPFTPVAAAILASCAAPFYFECVRLEKEGKGKYIPSEQGDIFGDGGIVNNYPIDIFDQPQFIPFEELKSMKEIINPHVLGLSLLYKYQMNDRLHPVNKTILPEYEPIHFTKSLLQGITLQLQKQNLQKRVHRDRTVQIDRLNIGLADFNLDESIKTDLIISGRQAVKNYFAEPRLQNFSTIANNDCMFNRNRSRDCIEFENNVQP